MAFPFCVSAAQRRAWQPAAALVFVSALCVCGAAGQPPGVLHQSSITFQTCL